MTIINNTAHSLAQNEALVAWAETRRLGLNAMKPNKQFRQRPISAILLMMVMCWASQSSAQPTRADVNQQTDLMQAIQTQFSIEEGDDMIFIAMTDAPPVPVHEIVQVASTSSDKVRNLTYGVCEFVLADKSFPGELSPKGLVVNLLTGNLKKDFGNGVMSDDERRLVYDFIDSVTVKNLSEPKHGAIFNKTSYLPNKDYIGKDRVDFLLEGKDLNGRAFAIRAKYYINVLPDAQLNEVIKSHKTRQRAEKEYCGTIESIWRVTDSQDFNFISVGTYTPTPSPLLGNYSNTAYPSLSYSFTDLPGTAVGQTTGSGTAANILLDINAAGRGWFMDSTPLSNDDYLPTSNPNEWIAKAGSAGADKMDLLSVLLHEYGHALGFEHSSDPHDFMGTSLTAGVRRLPTADEMQLMANLIGEIRAQNQRHSALDAESRTGFDEIAGLARNDKLLNDKLYSSRRLG